MNRLTEKIEDGRNILRRGISDIFKTGFGRFFDGEAIDRLAEYEDLEEQGKLLKLPCANWMDIVFGNQDVFWGIDFHYTIREITIDNSERMTWYGSWETVFLKGTDENGLDWEFSPEEIGKTVFLTQEQAELALLKRIEEDGLYESETPRLF